MPKILIIPLVNYKGAEIDIIWKKWLIDITEICILNLYAKSHVYLSLSVLRKVNAEIQLILNIIILFLGYFMLPKTFSDLKAEQNNIRER